MISHLIETASVLAGAGILVMVLQALVPNPAQEGLFRKRFWIAAALACLALTWAQAELLVDREISRSVLQIPALAFELSLVPALLRLARLLRPTGEDERPPTRRIQAAAFLLLLTLVPRALDSALKAMATGSMGLTSDALLAVLVVGGAALVPVILLRPIAWRTEVSPRLFGVVALVVLGLAVLDQFASLLQVLAARGALRGPWILKPLIFVVAHQQVFFYAQAAAAALLPLALLRRKRPPATGYPAEVRLQKAARRRLVTASAAVLVALGAGALFAASAPLWADVPVLAEAEPVQAVEGAVVVPFTLVEDGHLHRFAYGAKDGTEVMFIVIHKKGGAYGVGLDACEVCGDAGYFERRGQVICRQCDVQMNAATIGFRGGCNPIPLVYSVAPGGLVVPAAALEAATKPFSRSKP